MARLFPEGWLLSVLWLGLQVAVIATVGVALLNLVANMRLMRQLGDFGRPTSHPFVSILVPARNEEANIAACLRSLLAQDYPNYEIVALDDNSDDVSLSEQLLVPVLTWSFVLFLPLGLAYRSPRPELSIAIGQFMLFRRRAFDEIGGYMAVGHQLVDDLALVRAVKAHGLRWRLVDGSTRLHCRMYRGFRDVFRGFNKNIFPGFPGAVWSFVLTLMVAAVLLLQPPAVLLLHLAGVPLPEVSLALAAVAVSMSLLVVGLSYPRFGFPSYLMFLYPVTALATIAMSLSSLGLALLGQYSWKGRRLLRHKIRWW